METCVKSLFEVDEDQVEIVSPFHRMLYYHMQSVDVVGAGSERSEACLFVMHGSFNGASFSGVDDFGLHFIVGFEQCYASPVIVVGRGTFTINSLLQSSCKVSE